MAYFVRVAECRRCGAEKDVEADYDIHSGMWTILGNDRCFDCGSDDVDLAGYGDAANYHYGMYEE